MPTTASVVNSHQGPHGFERLEVSEELETIEAAMQIPAATGLLQFHECLDERPVHPVALRLQDIRSVSPRESGSLVRFGRNGVGVLKCGRPFS
ncbi:MAG: hypothetical protein WBX25_35970 [Rhodomicrobium sp.]